MSDVRTRSREEGAAEAREQYAAELCRALGLIGSHRSWSDLLRIVEAVADAVRAMRAALDAVPPQE